jgi:hypothetical protein
MVVRSPETLKASPRRDRTPPWHGSSTKVSPETLSRLDDTVPAGADSLDDATGHLSRWLGYSPSRNEI